MLFCVCVSLLLLNLLLGYVSVTYAIFIESCKTVALSQELMGIKITAGVTLIIYIHGEKKKQTQSHINKPVYTTAVLFLITHCALCSK